MLVLGLLKGVYCGKNLKMLANLHALPWAHMGDFNEVLSEEEKSGGNPICQRRVRAIQDCMNECHMMDLGFSGLKFTWSNKRDLGGDANVTHLARVNLDHCSLSSLI